MSRKTRQHDCVFFIQGGGKGAHLEDASLADSLEQALGPEYDVRYPQMPDEADPNVESWKRKISSELSHARGNAVLVAHSVSGSIALRYLAEEQIEQSISGLFLLAAPSWNEA
jgi:predicted alpha/beta hydrolase family esterase